MPSALDLAREERTDLIAREDAILKEADKGNIDPFRSELDEIHDKVTGIDSDILRLERAQAHDRTAPAAKGGQPTGPGAVDLGQPTPPDRRSLAQRFAESDEFKGWMERVAPNGHFGDKREVGASPVWQTEHLLSPTKATLVTGLNDTQAGAWVTNDIYPGTFAQGLQRPLTIRDVVTTGQTGSDTVEFVKLTGQTNAAAPTAESTSTASGGTKPESAIALAKVTTNVVTIAHWIPATKRALSDAGQLRTLIDSFLRYGLDEELEDQMVTGDGTGENFRGIRNTSGIQLQAYDTDLFTTTRKGRTKVRTVGRAVPTAYILHPTDWETIDLLADNEARFYGAGPFGLTPARLWGLPVVESEAEPVGVGHVGDMRKFVLWDREQANINVSDSHNDFFIRNMVAILAELRAAFGCVQPNAIVELDLTP